MNDNKNKNRNGLRILWIPGRKKQHHKGRFDSTNKTVTPNLRQKPNEQWALGGSFGQASLIKADVVGVSSLPAAMSIVPTVVPASVGVAEAVIQSPNVIEKHAEVAEICDNKENGVENMAKDDKDLNISTNDEDKSKLVTPSNMATLAIRDVRKKNRDKERSFDSIEKFADDLDGNISNSDNNLSEKLKPNGTSSTSTISSKKKKKKNRKSKKLKEKKSTVDEDGIDQDPKITCLYYTLMCCECSIS